MSQFDSETITALRGVLDEVCGHLPVTSTTVRTAVASQLLECARGGGQTYEALREAGIDALRRAPTMWQ